MDLIKSDHKLTLTIDVNCNVSEIHFSYVTVYSIVNHTFNILQAEGQSVWYGKQIWRQGDDLFAEFS